MAAVRLSDLAQKLGLNISTVSRALRDDPRVQEPTRRRVQAEAAALGYRPNLAARALAEGRSRTLWFLLPELDSPVEREPAAHAGRWLLDQGYDLLLALHHHDEAVYSRIVDRLLQGGADGALILPGSTGHPSAADLRLAASGFPVVYLDRPVPGVDAAVVTSNNEELAAGLVRRLVDRAGVPPVGFVVDGFHPGRNPVEAARSRGLRSAAAAAGLAVVAPGETQGQQGFWIASAQGGPEDWLAAGGRGAGFFDGWTGRLPDRGPLVSARQDFSAMAHRAAAAVLDRLKNQAPSPGTVHIAGAVEDLV